MLIASYICFVVGVICFITGYNITYVAWITAIAFFIAGVILGFISPVPSKKILRFISIFLNICGIAMIFLFILLIFLLTGFA